MFQFFIIINNKQTHLCIIILCILNSSLNNVCCKCTIALIKLYELITLQTMIAFRHSKYKRCSKYITFNDNFSFLNNNTTESSPVDSDVIPPAFVVMLFTFSDMNKVCSCAAVKHDRECDVVCALSALETHRQTLR